MKTNLKNIRKSAGWSNADDFAAHIGIPAKTYRNYEQGVRKIGLDVACKLCNELGCTIEELVDPNYVYALVDLPKEDKLDPDETKLIRYFRDMDEDGRKQLLSMAQMYALTNDPYSVWVDKDGNRYTAAELRGLK